jgi:large conductance mechanosensitive channel
MKIIQEFKTFAVKGNAIDLAVGVVIGAAFGKIVTSLVDDIITPIISFLTGSIDFSDRVFALPIPIGDVEPIVLRYGAFMTTIIDFAIIAFVIFLVIRQINKLKKTEDKKIEAKKASEEVRVLTEIRDLLARK